MTDPETYLSVLRDELAHVYAENLTLRARLAEATYDPASVLAFLNRVDPDTLEETALKNAGFGVRTGVAFVETLKEVASAQLGSRASED